MAKVKNTKSSGKLKSKSGKKRKWSVKVDEILQVILKMKASPIRTNR